MLFESGKKSRKLPGDIHRRAVKSLEHLDAAIELDDLRVPPGNHLEALSGNREGQHSIRINGKWRICFVWLDGNAFEVEITNHYD